MDAPFELHGQGTLGSYSDVGMSALSEATRMSTHSLCSVGLDSSSSTQSVATSPSTQCGSGSSVATIQAPRAPDGLNEAISCMVRHHLVQELKHSPAGQQPRDGSGSDAASLSAGVRTIVVSWLVEVAEEFRLQQETLHLAVGLLDRFLASSEQSVPRCVLQLLAVACVLLAAKEHEVTHPSVQQLCAVAANHFKPHDLLRMERIVLDVLDFSIASPSVYTFMHLYAQACSGCVTPPVLSLSMYLTELAMLEGGSGSSSGSGAFSHSCRAGAALLLAHLAIGDPAATPTLVWALFSCMGGFDFGAFQCCMAALLQLHQVAFQQAALAAAGAAAGGPGGPGSQPEDLLAPLRAKFGAACWCRVSATPPLASLPPVSVWACCG